MTDGPLLTIDFHATANEPATAVLVVIVMGIVIGAAFVSSRRR